MQSEHVNEEIKELTWIEPEFWGRLAWTFLFSTTVGLSSEDVKKMEMWREFIRILPKSLPCYSCKKECAHFLIVSPLPDRSPLKEVKTENKKCDFLCIKPKKCDFLCTPIDCRMWLCKLRRAIQSRNEKPSSTKQPQVTDEQMSQQFIQRINFQPLWYMDVYLFFYCVLQTANYRTAEGISVLVTFFHHALNLSPLPLGLTSPSTDNLRTKASALEWLHKGTKCNVLLLKRMSEFFPVHSKFIRRKKK